MASRKATLLLVLAIAPCALWAGQTEAPPLAVLAGQPPVVLVHGIWDTAAAFDAMASRLQSDGWQIFAISMKPNDGSAPLEALAEELRLFIDERVGPEKRFSLVGYSMGGLVARYYAQRLGGLDRLVHFVTISTPHNGTNMAYLESLAGVREMRPDSLFLRDLASDADRLKLLSVTSIWSPQDLVIAPADSARLPLGKTVRVPGVLHPFMLRDNRVIDAVEAALKGD